MTGINRSDPNQPDLQVSYSDLQSVKDNLKDGKAEVIVTLIQRTSALSMQGREVSYFKITVDNVTPENFNETVNATLVGDLTKLAVLHKLGETNGAKQIDVNFNSLVIHKQDGNIKQRSRDHKSDKYSQFRLLNDSLNNPETKAAKPGIGERFKNNQLELEDFRYLYEKNPSIKKNFIEDYQGKDLQEKTKNWTLLEQKANEVCRIILKSTNRKPIENQTTALLDTIGKGSETKEETDPDVIKIRELINIAMPIACSSTTPGPTPKQIDAVIEKIATFKEEQIEKLTLLELEFILDKYKNSEIYKTSISINREQITLFIEIIDKIQDRFDKFNRTS